MRNGSSPIAKVPLSFEPWMDSTSGAIAITAAAEISSPTRMHASGIPNSFLKVPLFHPKRANERRRLEL